MYYNMYIRSLRCALARLLFPLLLHTDGILEDVCDGTLFSEHPLFGNDPYALQIISFFDELELCNPLGTHVKKHKPAIVLFTLGNIQPKYRSSLRLIHLVIAATAPVVERHGIDSVLQPFIQDLSVCNRRCNCYNPW